MRLTIDQAKTALTMYIENEIANRATGLMKFGTYFFMGSILSKFDKVVEKLKANPIVAMTDIIDENNIINADELYTLAKDSMNKVGSITLFGIIFKPEDIDKLYEYMRQV